MRYLPSILALAILVGSSVTLGDWTPWP